MMDKIIGTEQIKANALRVYDGMTEVMPQFKSRSSFDFICDTVTRVGDRKYCLNNSTICFTLDGELYAAPYSDALMTALYDERFTQAYFYVPFSNWGYPERESAAWTKLREDADRRRHEEFVRDCQRYCEQHRLGGTLAPEVLDKCLEIPESGVSVQHPHFTSTYYPQVRRQCLDCESVDLIGRYNANNSTICFNTNDGRTFITRDWSVMEALYKAGYQPGNLFVPMSNGEVIVNNPALKSRWDTLTSAKRDSLI